MWLGPGSWRKSETFPPTVPYLDLPIWGHLETPYPIMYESINHIQSDVIGIYVYIYIQKSIQSYPIHQYSKRELTKCWNWWLSMLYHKSWNITPLRASNSTHTQPLSKSWKLCLAVLGCIGCKFWWSVFHVPKVNLFMVVFRHWYVCRWKIPLLSLPMSLGKHV